MVKGAMTKRAQCRGVKRGCQASELAKRCKGIRVNGPSGLRAGARAHSEKGQMCVGDLPKEEMGGEWVKRKERAEGLKKRG